MTLIKEYCNCFEANAFKPEEISDKSKTRIPVVRRHVDDPSHFTEYGYESA